MANIKFDIEYEYGVISESSKGWRKELNLVNWNNNKPKYDIREWDQEHEKMGKGLTFTDEELKALKEILNNMDI